MVELWSPKPEWIAMSTDDRQKFFDQLLEKVNVPGFGDDQDMVTLGMCQTESFPHSTRHTWMAVWQAPDKQTFESFIARVESGGWFDLWEQEHAVGQLLPFDDAIQRQIDA